MLGGLSYQKGLNMEGSLARAGFDAVDRQAQGRYAGELENGEDVIIVPSVSDEEAKGLFAQGWRTLQPYLRLAKQPRQYKSVGHSTGVWFRAGLEPVEGLVQGILGSLVSPCQRVEKLLLGVEGLSGHAPTVRPHQV